MKGTLANTAAVLLGSAIGLAAGRRIPERFKEILMQCLGLSTLFLGIQMALSGRDAIPAVGALLLGAVTGEALRLEAVMEGLGRWLKERSGSSSSTFVEAFVTTSLLYCTGAMVIVGSIQDGTTGDATTLYMKSLLDGVASVAFASTLGIGVAFSALTVLVVQGALTLLASHLAFLQGPAVMGAITATGGLIIMGIGLNLLHLTRIPIGNLVPALVYAVIYAVLWAT
ncbi:MAG TPA: DUF554 domain-containing protein [Syntrophales bacterium]|nr:DUF554 domain-containing protein [Syntrophales bacterium]HOM07413.1 DUF554 domain-containing protein [Syntrophales bacterium]HON99985.1 DUF554 domain-containing protein [Syntrophales bacterium]HPC01505.1 DUF554 domain-containing protein [Syntrophales bacterium]HPQ07054.1 DUF554 domain-containing protein [Syntrophales bacterium]